MPDTIVFVMPRYGLEFAGGAEALARQLVEELHRTGVPVEVLTTCTNDMIVWNNAYPPGATVINSVPVQRFPTDSVDIDMYHQIVAKAFTAPQTVTYRDQQLFVRNSIHSQALYTHLGEHAERYRFCIVAPYLFGTTYHAGQIMKDKTIHIPCLHDEPFAYFAIFHEMFEEARGILFNAPEEEQLARRLGIFNPAAAVVGCGFRQPPPGNPLAPYVRHQLGDVPFLLYLGRFDISKNFPLLIDYFLRYKREHTNPVRLVLTGHGPTTPPDDPDIVNLGFLPAEQMNDTLAAAAALAQLSVRESFSIVIMESWLQKRPVIVHSDCPVTHGHVERSGGGWAVGSYEEFAAALDMILSAPEVADQRGAAGQQYVAREYSWEAVLHRFHEAADRFMAPRSLYQTLSQRGRRRALDFTEQRYEERLRNVIEQVTRPVPAATAYKALLEPLRDLARISRPDYQVRSRLPVIGRLIAWIRTQLTSHLREPYLDPILAQQERFNLAMQNQIAELTQLIWRMDQQSAARTQQAQQVQIAELQARIRQLEAQVASQIEELVERGEEGV
jgi:glycosyltransferase involved in cell wall biosynthesis